MKTVRVDPAYRKPLTDLRRFHQIAALWPTLAAIALLLWVVLHRCFIDESLTLSQVKWMLWAIAVAFITGTWGLLGHAWISHTFAERMRLILHLLTAALTFCLVSAFLAHAVEPDVEALVHHVPAQASWVDAMFVSVLEKAAELVGAASVIVALAEVAKKTFVPPWDAAPVDAVIEEIRDEFDVANSRDVTVLRFKDATPVAEVRWSEKSRTELAVGQRVRVTLRYQQDDVARISRMDIGEPS